MRAYCAAKYESFVRAAALADSTSASGLPWAAQNSDGPTEYTGSQKEPKIRTKVGLSSRYLKDDSDDKRASDVCRERSPREARVPRLETSSRTGNGRPTRCPRLRRLQGLQG